MNAMKTTYRIATVLLIILGTAFGPQAVTADHFSDTKKKAIFKSNKISPFEGFYIHPNPADQLLFSHPEKYKPQHHSTISVFSPCGKLVKEFTIDGEFGDENLCFLSPGVYYLKIHNTDGDDYRKVLKN